ncbi:MAG: hypothetical protein ACP5D2_02670 [Candidatus Nanoarchaeia archaeon]
MKKVKSEFYKLRIPNHIRMFPDNSNESPDVFLLFLYLNFNKEGLNNGRYNSFY